MKAYKTLAVMLTYPHQELIANLRHIETTLTEQSAEVARLAEPLMKHISKRDLLSLQEEYVATFDTKAANSLYLTEHTHGDTRERGAALSDMVDRYRAHGLQLIANELPDYLPLFLEFLSTLPERAARAELAPFLPVIAKIREKLQKFGSPYQHVFMALENLAASPGSARPRAPTHPPQHRLFFRARNTVAAVFARRPSHDVF